MLYYRAVSEVLFKIKGLTKLARLDVNSFHSQAGPRFKIFLLALLIAKIMSPGLQALLNRFEHGVGGS